MLWDHKMQGRLAPCFTLRERRHQRSSSGGVSVPNMAGMNLSWRASSMGPSLAQYQGPLGIGTAIQQRGSI